MNNSDARSLFGDEAKNYDATVALVDPFYEEMHSLLLRLAHASSLGADEAHDQPMLALDIGSGTGKDGIALLKKIPQLNLVGIDSSAAMHSIFEARAKDSDVPQKRFHLVKADIRHPSMAADIPRIASEAFGEANFDIIMSALTLHHFTHAEKLEAFRLIFSLLRPGGVFLLGDLFNYDEESTWLTRTISDWETTWIGNNFNASAKSAKESGQPELAANLVKLKDKWLRHYSEENKLESVTTQCTLLKEAGFLEIGNPFRYWQVGLIFAKK